MKKTLIASIVVAAIFAALCTGLETETVRIDDPAGAAQYYPDGSYYVDGPDFNGFYTYYIDRCGLYRIKIIGTCLISYRCTESEAEEIREKLDAIKANIKWIMWVLCEEFGYCPPDGKK